MAGIGDKWLVDPLPEQGLGGQTAHSQSEDPAATEFPPRRLKVASGSGEIQLASGEAGDRVRPTFLPPAGWVFVGSVTNYAL